MIAVDSGVGLFGGTQVQRAPSPSAHATVDNNGGEPLKVYGVPWIVLVLVLESLGADV